jgi:GTPase SAR1 family protein
MKESIPMSMVEEEPIHKFMKELLENSEEWKALKLVVLGHGEIGKTSLLRKMEEQKSIFSRV